MSTTAQTEILRQPRGNSLRAFVLGTEPSAARLTQSANDLGFAAGLTDDRRELFAQIAQAGECVVICDAELSPIDARSLVTDARRINPLVETILVVDRYDTETAIEALRVGAYDVLQKPVQRTHLKSTLDGLAERLCRPKRIQQIERQLAGEFGLHGMVGCTPAMQGVFDDAQRFARHFSSMLLIGAAGVGKETLAHAIHEMSPSVGHKFLVYPCGAALDLPGGSQLFAPSLQKQRAERFRDVGLAMDGTLFLKEADKASPPLQTKLLEAIGREHGSSASVENRGSFRIIAAASPELQEGVRAGRFREDLYRALSKVQICVPALAERREDIPLLARFFLDRYRTSLGKPILGIAPAATAALQNYDWPGNVRELEAVILAAAQTSTRGTIDLEDLPEHLQRPRNNGLVGTDWEPAPLRDVRREHIEKVLDFCHGNRVRAAQLLGIGRTSLYRYLKRRGRNATDTHEA